MSDTPDTNLQLKKKARRRLVGAVAFAGLAAVILPMIMDEEPKQQIQDVQIRIPGQDQAPFNPDLPQDALPDSAEQARNADREAVAVKQVPEAEPAKPEEKKVEKKVEKSVENAPVKALEKAAEKSGDTPSPKLDDTKRAVAILNGKTFDPPVAVPSNSDSQFVILIGAFSNPANVKQLQSKIGELGVKVYTEPLDSPDGKKTRVRAGPFASRDAADKALAKLKKIGVNGIIAAKQ